MISKIGHQNFAIQKTKLHSSQKKSNQKASVSFEGESQKEIRIAINAGTGRIGKNAFQQITGHISRMNETAEQILGDIKEIPVKLKLVVMNVGTDEKVKNIESLLQRDSVLGYFPAKLSSEMEGDKKFLLVGDGNNQQRIHIVGTRNIPDWEEDNVDIVIDATGVLTNAEKLSAHLNNGAKRVLLSSPPKGDGINSYIFGVNHDLLTPEEKIVSNASCTTNCSSTVTELIHRIWGVLNGKITTIHGATQTQNIHDKDLGKARATLDNMIPTTTGAAKEIGKVIQDLRGKMIAQSIRVPVLDGSMIDNTYNLLKSASKEEVKEILDIASKNKELRQFIGEAPVESTGKDILGRFENAVYLPDKIEVLGDKTLSLDAWYDNEFGYTANLLNTARLMGAQLTDVEYKPRTIKEVIPELITK